MSLPLSPSSPPPARIAELCLAAREYVERRIGAAPEVSEESLAFVDHYVGLVRGEGAVKDEVLRLLSAALGAYFGEVIISRFGGAWRVAEGGDSEDPAAWRIDLGAVPLSVAPVGLAASAILQEEAEDEGFSTRPELRPLLLSALERAAPVSEDYYYSLTGRFETLAYMADVLADVLRQRDEKLNAAQPPPEEEA